MEQVADALAEAIAALDETDWAVEVVDAQWRLVWASNEMKLVLGMGDDEIGLGLPLFEAHKDMSFAAITDESRRGYIERLAPYVMYDLDLTPAEVADMVDERHRDAVLALEPAKPPVRWTVELDFEGIGGVRGLGSRIQDEDGHLVGTAFLYGSALPASILAFVARGSRRQFRRMADLVEPGRRNAAILFADIEGSTDRSRRLPSARYFEYIHGLNSAIDDVILREGGIIGKHAGDGVSAFFLAEHLGSLSSAARAGIAAARDIVAATRETGPDWRINIGVHWGATLYMGQIATSGRLEVTALGDEVNECARIQEAAQGGQVLASKALLERLDPEDAFALGLDPAAISYALLGEVPGAGEKVRRDAGALPVAELGP